MDRVWLLGSRASLLSSFCAWATAGPGCDREWIQYALWTDRSETVGDPEDTFVTYLGGRLVQTTR